MTHSSSSSCIDDEPLDLSASYPSSIHNRSSDCRWRRHYCAFLFLTTVTVLLVSRWDPGSNQSIRMQQLLFRDRPSHSLPHDAFAGVTYRHHLVLHVGPSKTATTSLQTDLTALQEALHADGYAYAGRYYTPKIDADSGGTIRLGRSQSSLLETAHAMLKQCPHQDDQRWRCCKTFAQELDAYVQQQGVPHVILSEEPFGNQWRHPQDWVAIMEALRNTKTNSNQWHVTVVVGYRHFYAWLPSARFQHERLDRINPVWPEPYGTGRSVQPFYPDWYSGMEYTSNFNEEWNKNFQHTANILDSMNHTVEDVRILNLHNDQHYSPLRLLLCGSTTRTPTACRQALRREQEQHHETVMNTQSSVPSPFYDALATVAAAFALVNTTAHTRTQVRDAIQYRHETVLGLTLHDLPLQCPPAAVLEQLRNTSLALEERCLSSPPTTTASKELHRAGFDEYVEHQQYCFVDTEAVLNDPEWRDFLRDQFG